MTSFKAVIQDAPGEDVLRSSIGGSAILPSAPPLCRDCNSNLLLFLQFDIEEDWSLPFEPGSHLAILMCPDCNEIPSFDDLPDGQLPDQFWEGTEGHFLATLSKPGQDEVVVPQAPLLVRKSLSFEPFEGEGHAPDVIRVGGSPWWLQNPRSFRCSCGANMAFIAQIAENFGFEKQADAPQQPDTFSADDYGLFLGNEVYLLACERQCNPRAVWVEVQG